MRLCHCPSSACRSLQTFQTHAAARCREVNLGSNSRQSHLNTKFLPTWGNAPKWARRFFDGFPFCLVRSRNILDDFREAYYWLRQNTDEHARVMSWWDYGYQIAGMANRTTLVDNNTWNNSHIALVSSLASIERVHIRAMLHSNFWCTQRNKLSLPPATGWSSSSAVIHLFDLKKIYNCQF